MSHAIALRPGGTLARWLAGRDGALERAGMAPVRNDISASQGGDSLYELFGVQPPGSGSSVAVTPISAQRVSAVVACVQRIASISTLPVHVYERTATTPRRVESPLHYLLNEQPTPSWTAASHWEWVVQNTLLRGDSYTQIVRDRRGDPAELVPLHWHNVIGHRLPGGRLMYAVQDPDNKLKVSGVDQDDMLHFVGFGYNGLCGMSAIKYSARAAISNALAMDEYSGAFFRRGAHPSIVLETEKGMKDDTLANLQAAFAAKYSGVQNFFDRPLVLTEGVKAREISINAEDAQLLEARRFQVVDIARAFGVPPHMIGESSATTSWGSGIEQLGRAFVIYTLQQHLVRIEQELCRKLCRAGSRQYLEYNRDALMEGDSKSQSEYFRAALGGPGTGPGWMRVDDVRALKNMPPLGGLAAQIYDPRDVAAKVAGPASPAPASPAPKPTEGES